MKLDFPDLSVAQIARRSLKAVASAYERLAYSALFEAATCDGSV